MDDDTSMSLPGVVRVFNPLETGTWDAALASIPGATFFHSQAWARVLHETYAFTPYYHGLIQTNRIAALFPLMEVNSWVTGRRGISLPFTDHIEPLCPTKESFEQLLGAVAVFAKQRSWKYLEIRGGGNWLAQTRPSGCYFRHQLDLTSEANQLLSGFSDSVRRAIRKAERSELRLEFSQSLPAVRSFYRLVCMTRRRHGVPPQPFSFYSNIQRHILATNKGSMVLAYQGLTPIAGAMYFHFGKHAIYKFGASDERWQHLRANNLVMWNAIQHYASSGFSHLDFGRTSASNLGLRAFKQGWGTQEHSCEYVRYDDTGRPVAIRDGSIGWHTAIFRSLPSVCARWAGALLYRHIA